MYQKSLFIFHRDLRLEDNTGLIGALRKSKEVLPIFIFEQKQLKKNPYHGKPVVQFMFESLEDLDKNLQNHNSQLYCFYGDTIETLREIIQENNIEAVFSNRDYTPFARERDTAVQNLCNELNIDFHMYADALLQEPETVHKDDGLPYTIYTPFMKKSRQFIVSSPEKNTYDNYCKEIIPKAKRVQFFFEELLESSKKIAIHGGRKNALEVMENIEKFYNYDEERNIPELSATTLLSAHNKFGTISIREIYAAIKETFGGDHTLIRELYWRDFFTHIALHFPHVFKRSFREKYSKMPWNENQEWFQRWCDGKTGFPIVDAGMRELNETGFMHNRVRMIVASFLVKDLHINWQWGEKYFAQKLIDYDPSVNNGNWQWAASTGCDAQPYFRIFNPWLQQKRFDSNCVYIKRWIPELKDKTPKEIHTIFKTQSEQSTSLFEEAYPLPMVDHKIVAQKAKDMFKYI